MSNHPQFHTAQEMYLNTDYTQGQIADMLKIGQHTIGKWKVKYGWDELKQSSQLTGPRLRKKILQACNDVLDGKGIVNAKDVDMVIKLANAADKIDKTKLSLSARINAYKELVSWLFGINQAMAKELTPLIDKFIAEVISGTD